MLVAKIDFQIIEIPLLLTLIRGLEFISWHEKSFSREHFTSMVGPLLTLIRGLEFTCDGMVEPKEKEHAYLWKKIVHAPKID